MSLFDDDSTIWDPAEVMGEEKTEQELVSVEQDFLEWEKKLAEARRAAEAAMALDDDQDDFHELGDADDYHNKSCEFARKKDYKKAIEVCEAGLKHGLNADLTGDLINYFGKIGRFDRVHHYLDLQMEKIKKAAWTWRSYTFAIDGLINEGAEKNEAVLRELVKDYQRHLPHEEKSYMAEFDLEHALGNHTQALAALERAVKNHPAAEQCALKLADLLIESGEFKRAREIAIRAVSASSQSQPGIRTAYAAFVICLCEDAMLWRAMAEGEEPDVKVVIKLVKKYEMLKEHFMLKLIPYHDQIDDRINLLKLMIQACDEM